MLPKFHDLAGEDTYKHLKEFHVVYSTMRPWSSKGLAVSVAGHVQHMGRHETYVPRKILPDVQDCDHLERDMWNQATLRGDTTQVLGEVQQVVCHVSAPSNQRITFITVFLRRFIDDGPKHGRWASGGALMDKTPAIARHLISNMASNTQGGASTSRVVSEVGTFDNLRLENQLMELTSLARQFVVGQNQQNTQRVCAICTSMKYPTNMCPTLTIGRYCKSNAVSRFRKHPLTDDSELERGRSRRCDVTKW
ncbi:hypothetical protein CR513_09936, partial [Mucuna pruriens]